MKTSVDNPVIEKPNNERVIEYWYCPDCGQEVSQEHIVETLKYVVTSDDLIVCNNCDNVMRPLFKKATKPNVRIPRKLKKKIKSVILKGKDTAWKTKEVRIVSFERLPAERTKGYIRMGVPYVNGKLVTSYRLGV